MIEQLTNLFENSTLLTKCIIYGYTLIVGLQVSFYYRYKNKIKQLLYVLITFGIYYYIIYFFTAIALNIYVYIYVLPTFFISILFFFIYKLFFENKTIDKPLIIKIPFTSGKEVTIDLQKGLSTQGAAGSGKTLSIAGWILYWMGKRNIGGVLYDYKDMEFVEMVNYFYRDSTIPVLVFAPYEPGKSIQFNPISVDQLVNHEHIKLMSKCIVDNVLKSDKGGSGDFFEKAAEGAITGVIYTLKEFYPEECSFTYLAAIFLTKDVDNLVRFIEKSKQGSIHARAFLDSQDSEKQMAAVKATLSNSFSVFANPNIFYTLLRNSEDFSINESHNKCVFCLVNKPSYDDIYSPILSIVLQSLIYKMSERNRDESFILLDEAPTLKVNRIGKVPATMRSFKVSTIYMLQDTIQAVIQMGRDKMKEIFANLSTIAIGKTNDPDTAKHFESYFEEITKKQKSISFRSGSFSAGDERTSISEKNERKHKSSEMFKRDTGEFFIFDEKGNSHDGRIKKVEYEPVTVKTINKISSAELESIYIKILDKAKIL